MNKGVEILTTKEFFRTSCPVDVVGWVFLCDGEDFIQLYMQDMRHVDQYPDNKGFKVEGAYKLLWRGSLPCVLKLRKHLLRLLDFETENGCMQAKCGISETRRVLIEASYKDVLPSGNSLERNFVFYENPVLDDLDDTSTHLVHFNFLHRRQYYVNFAKWEIGHRRVTMWSKIGSHENDPCSGLLAPYTPAGFPLEMLVPYIQETNVISLNQKLIRRILDEAFNKAKGYFEEVHQK